MSISPSNTGDTWIVGHSSAGSGDTAIVSDVGTPPDVITRTFDMRGVIAAGAAKIIGKDSPGDPVELASWGHGGEGPLEPG